VLFNTSLLGPWVSFEDWTQLANVFVPDKLFQSISK
jgi:hypothetical protein